MVVRETTVGTTLPWYLGGSASRLLSSGLRRCSMQADGETRLFPLPAFCEHALPPNYSWEGQTAYLSQCYLN